MDLKAKKPGQSEFHYPGFDLKWSIGKLFISATNAMQ
jgi:hypothetical protein